MYVPQHQNTIAQQYCDSSDIGYVSGGVAAIGRRGGQNMVVAGRVGLGGSAGGRDGKGSGGRVA